MGRPKEHDEQTASALLAAAERTIHEHGIGALSLRELAVDAGTTTRAVYSLFGSKDGLLGALGARAFELLQAGLETLPESDDPCDDLVEAGLMFRRFALGHSALFSIGIQVTEPSLWPRFRAAASEADPAAHRHEKSELPNRTSTARCANPRIDPRQSRDSAAIRAGSQIVGESRKDVLAGLRSTISRPGQRPQRATNAVPAEVHRGDQSQPRALRVDLFGRAATSIHAGG